MSSTPPCRSADAQTAPGATSDAAAWASVGVLGLAVLTCQMVMPLRFALTSLATLATACAALGAAAWFYRAARPHLPFAVMCVALIHVLLFSALASILSYQLAQSGGALWDARLAAWDRALGLDWLAYVRAVDRHHWLTTLFKLAYASLIPQILALILALGFTARLDRLRQVMLAAILCGTLCVLLSPFAPALSNFVNLDLTAADFRHVNPWAGYIHLADFTALRDGTMAELRLDAMQGIITFPSYHAGLSAVTLWGFWTSGLAWLRWSGAPIAVATIAATPVDGGHYFVDVIAGGAIALASIAVAVRLVRWTPALPRFTASPYRRSRAASVR